MKYLIILADGMADEPIESLGGKTPLQFAHTPVMDALARKGCMGTVKIVPDSMSPGSDVANLSVLGYDPLKNYTGRSPLEALSVGVAMEPTDVVLRCNLVTVTEDEPYTKKKILDHSAGEISTEDADILMEVIRKRFNSSAVQFFTGTSYRHICLLREGELSDLVPPHDHLGEVIGPYLPQNTLLEQMMEESYQILNDHPLNLARAAASEAKANSLWFWGAGTKPGLGSFREMTGLTGGVVSAVDLIKGIGVGAGMKILPVEGATGSLHTNYEGKADAAVDALLRGGCDFVFVHVEAPDEMGHQGNTAHKVLSIEYLDQRLIGRIVAAMDASGEAYRMLILPDHPTPIRLRTHTKDPVPWLLYDSENERETEACFSESEAAATENFEPEGYRLIQRLIKEA